MANALQFPSNGDAPAAAPVIFRYTNPQGNGLPVWGPSNSGVTLLWRVKYRQHTGYYVNWWYGPYSSFPWNLGSPDTYYGCHPHPQSGGGAGTVHEWEIAIDGGDAKNTLAGSPKTVFKGEWFTQGVRVTYNGDNTKTLRFYTALPSVANADVIEATVGSGYGNSYAGDHAIYFGDSGWAIGEERMSGSLSSVKIIAKVLSEADLLSEAANMAQLVTTDAQSNIWWGKSTFDSVDDLTCDYGTGRAFAWVDTDNKATLEPQGTFRAGPARLITHAGAVLVA